MKGTTRKQLLRLLRLTTALILLVAMLAACGKEDTEQTLNNLDNLDPTGTSTSEPTDEPTEEPTAPPETEAPAPSVMGTVSTDLLNVRTGPSSDAALAGQLNKGARVEILEQTTVDGEEWGRTEVGWLRLDYVTLDDASQTPEETTDPTTAPDTKPDSTTTSGTKGTITASELNIRKGAGTSYDSVGKYKKGDTVTILETKNNWGRTDKGWISMKYVDLDGTSANTKEDTTDNKEATTLVTDGKTTVLGYVVIDVDALYVRYGPGTKYDVVDKVLEGEKVAYYQEKNGWARIKDGWISLAYTDKADSSDDKDDDKDDATLVTDKSTKVLGYAVVNTGALNTRYGPGTSHDIKDKVYAGERLAYYQKDGNWVRTEEGWISLSYAYVEGQTGSKTGSGTITGDNLNVRKGPGTSYDSVGKLNKGDTVKILEQITVGGTTWGYTGEGWVSMDFVKLA